MKHDYLLPLACLALPWAVSSIPRQAQDTEPQGYFTLAIDDDRTTLLPGEKKTIEIGGREHEIRLEEPTHRIFDKEGIHFEYPYGMAYEFDGSTPGVGMWNMDGNAVVLMVQVYDLLDASQVSASLLQGMRDQFESMGSEVRSVPCELELEGRTLEGDELRIEFAGFSLVQELYCLDGPEGGVAVILQDSRDASLSPSGEFEAVRESFAASFWVEERK